MPSLKVKVDRVFHALGNPTRRAIVEKLSQGPLSVSALAAPLDMTLTAVAQHLQVLEESGLVRTEKLGRVRTCQIETAGLIGPGAMDPRSPLHAWGTKARSAGRLACRARRT